ncbi:MAG TPA: hypothetical protein PLX35_16290 [Cyclobacteriaceae bacterium]|nr:hypothetical protein [Cyclobacteriaceae bacterium]
MNQLLGLGCICIGLSGCISQPVGPHFLAGVQTGINKNHDLEEVSGIAESMTIPGHMWAINDSGNSAELFLLNESGAGTVKKFKLSGIDNRDWEDIVLVKDSLRSYLYIGDIGDNLARYEYKYIYRVPEPSLTDSSLITRFDTLQVKLEGENRDTEALLFDPLTLNLYLVSKREQSVILFEISYPYSGNHIIAHPVATLPVTRITAGSISTDGKEILLKNYEHIYYWRRDNDEPLAQLLQQKPTKLAYTPELQGEAITWAHDGSGFYTLSENGRGERAPLYFYKRK